MEDANTIAWDIGYRVVEKLQSFRIPLSLLSYGHWQQANAISCRKLFRQGNPCKVLMSMPSDESGHVCEAEEHQQSAA